ncbi:MAG: tryptophan 7-halogenase [Gemmatimonadaceae bacterium]|nr:tryptophan 7-halogenase [Gemmatimonadaceae bacterium]
METIPGKADVVVIGGGPAGSTAANLLAHRGYHVVLLDQARHPRLMVGESILPHIWKYMDQLGAAEDIEKAGFIKKAGGTAIWRGVIRQMRLADFGFVRPSLHVERAEFDEILLRVAERRGVQAFEEVVVRQVHVEGSEKSVSYADRRSGQEGRITCKFIVDASGQGAVIANQLGFREFDKDLRFMSVWGYYENSAYIAHGGSICEWGKRREIRPTTVQAGIGDWGWCWHIVQKESTSVGLVLAPAQAAEFKSGGDKLEERFDRACRRIPIIGDLLQEARFIPGSVHAIRDFAYRPTQLAGDGWFLAGDAAAFVDPINSAGVVTALYTGYAAASAVDESFKKPASRAYYTEVFSTLVRQRLSLFRISALPAGQNSFPEDNALALKCAQLDSRDEQELLFAQTQLTDRPGNLAPMHAMDPRLNYTSSTRYQEVPALIPLGAELQAAG